MGHNSRVLTPPKSMLTALDIDPPIASRVLKANKGSFAPHAFSFLFYAMNKFIARTSPAMTPSDPAARPRHTPNSSGQWRPSHSLCVAKKRNPCYAFLFAGLTSCRSEASGSKMEKRDGVDLMFQLGARWERIFFFESAVTH